MSEKPEALRLAHELDAYHNAPHHKLAAIELRRLHAENERLREALRPFAAKADTIAPAIGDGAQLACDFVLAPGEVGLVPGVEVRAFRMAQAALSPTSRDSKEP